MEVESSPQTCRPMSVYVTEHKSGSVRYVNAFLNVTTIAIHNYMLKSDVLSINKNTMIV